MVGAGDPVDIFAGLGFSASGSLPDEPTVEHRTAWSVQGGFRLRPFAGAVRGLGFEVRATRFSHGIGEVHALVAPSLSWTF